MKMKLGIKIKKISIIVLITVAALIGGIKIFSFSDQNDFNNNLQKNVVMKSVTFDNLKRLSAPKPPIISAQDSISYTINIDSIRSSIENVVLKANFVTWNVNAQLITENATSWWEVKIKSSGMLPSFTCIVSFTQEGELFSSGLAEDYCEYNK